MNRHNAKPHKITIHYERAMSRAWYMARHPNKQTVKTWAAHLIEHMNECTRMGK